MSERPRRTVAIAIEGRQVELQSQNAARGRPGRLPARVELTGSATKVAFLTEKNDLIPARRWFSLKIPLPKIWP